MIPFHSHTLRHWLAVHFFAVLISLAALSASAQTPVPAHAFTAPATKVTGTNALLNGAAMANGSATTAWFEWGTSTNYGSQTESVAIGDGSSLVWLNSQIQDLTPGQVYHFRLAVSNQAAVVYGADQVFALGKKIWGWGLNYHGQANIPEGLSNVTAIAAGSYHSLALREDTTVFGWGPYGASWYNRGQADVPLDLTNVIAIAAGDYHSLALREDGTVLGWGDDASGQANPPEDLTNVVAIAVGGNYSLALKRDGTVVAWGGGNRSMNFASPAGLSNVVAISAGFDHCLAIKIDGTVKAWGNYDEAQTDATPQLTNIVAVSAGSCRSAALRSDRTVLSWGSNLYPVPQSGDVVAVAVAANNTCLTLTTHGTILSWRFYEFAGVPQDVTNAVAISAAYYHNLALGGNQPPRISELNNVSIFPRESVEFYAVAEGTGPLFYQWKKGATVLVDNARISGAATPNLTISGITLADAGSYTLTVTNLAGIAKADGVLTVLTPSTRPYHGLFSDSPVSMETAGALRNFIITPTRTYSGNLILNGKTYHLAGRFDVRGGNSRMLSAAPRPIYVLLQLLQVPGIGSVLAGHLDNSQPTKWSAFLLAFPAHTLSPSSQLVRLTSSGAGNAPRGSSMGLLRLNGSVATFTGSLPDGTACSISTPIVSGFEIADSSIPVHAALYNGRGLLNGWSVFRDNRYEGNLTWIKKASNGQYPRGFTNELHIETLTPGIRR